MEESTNRKGEVVDEKANFDFADDRILFHKWAGAELVYAEFKLLSCA